MFSFHVSLLALPPLSHFLPSSPIIFLLLPFLLLLMSLDFPLPFLSFPSFFLFNSSYLVFFPSLPHPFLLHVSSPRLPYSDSDVSAAMLLDVSKWPRRHRQSHFHVFTVFELCVCILLLVFLLYFVLVLTLCSQLELLMCETAVKNILVLKVLKQIVKIMAVQAVYH